VTRTLTRTAIAALLLLAVTLTVGLAAPRAQAAPSLRGKLLAAQRELDKANQRLAVAQAALDAALATDPTTATTPAPTPSPSPAEAPTAALSARAADDGGRQADVAVLKAKVEKAQKQVRAWKKRVQQLAAQVQQEERIDGWERQGQWMPIIRIAAAKYHVRADGMYRMMMRESGGLARAGATSAFKGLFQYWTGTWNNSWNPWRAESIYDGSSQIFATAYAIHRGLGPQMWTTTFASQY
jgi:hypothetical protein